MEHCAKQENRKKQLTIDYKEQTEVNLKTIRWINTL
jgi:hypothetical protein